MQIGDFYAQYRYNWKYSLLSNLPCVPSGCRVQSLRLSQSVKTQAEVVNVEIEESIRGSSEIYTYRYYADGIGYIESTGSFSWTSHDVGDAVTVHYTPAEPTRLVHPELIPVFMVTSIACFIGLISQDPYDNKHK